MRLLLVVAVLSLSACSGGKLASPADVIAKADASPANTLAAARQGGWSHAHYSVGNTTVTFRHALRLPDFDGKIRLLLTPDVLDPEEQERIRNHPMPELLLLTRTAAGFGERYPHVIIDILPDGSFRSGGVSYLSVTASCIVGPTHTDNISRTGSTHGVELLEVDDDRVRLRARGHAVIDGVRRDWVFDVTT